MSNQKNNYSVDIKEPFRVIFKQLIQQTNALLQEQGTLDRRRKKRSNQSHLQGIDRSTKEGESSCYQMG
jgi:hypothetical protein